MQRFFLDFALSNIQIQFINALHFDHHTLHMKASDSDLSKRFAYLLYSFEAECRVPNTIKYLLNMRRFYFVLTDRKTFISFTHKYITNEQILHLFNKIQIQRLRDWDCNIIFIGFSSFACAFDHVHLNRLQHWFLAIIYHVEVWIVVDVIEFVLSFDTENSNEIFFSNKLNFRNPLTSMPFLIH